MARDCNLIDIGFQGAPFTWQRGKVYVRLDRVLVNIQWQLEYPDANVFHLSPLKSDHSMIRLNLSSPLQSDCRRRPFRFEAAWITHLEFQSVLRNSWNVAPDWNKKKI
uniref:Endonuclease/exonuclease/phosphatase domain-containing protein n=2 Tax=Cajanus cajan TaxID=3821 RepID=A0A151RUL4_CAJCA|nr:hypothetical protein KK1_032214 [Cajanus cajan]